MTQLKALVWSFMNCSSYLIMARTLKKPLKARTGQVLVTITNAKDLPNCLIRGDAN